MAYWLFSILAGLQAKVGLEMALEKFGNYGNLCHRLAIGLFPKARLAIMLALHKPLPPDCHGSINTSAPQWA
jgi:hypothetical protein